MSVIDFDLDAKLVPIDDLLQDFLLKHDRYMTLAENTPGMQWPVNEAMEPLAVAVKDLVQPLVFQYSIPACASFPNIYFFDGLELVKLNEQTALVLMRLAERKKPHA